MIGSSVAQKPETLFAQRIRPYLEAMPRTWITKLQQKSLRGDPDLVLVVNGHAVHMELKRDGKQKPDPLQLHRLTTAAAAGAYAFVVHPDNWFNVHNFLLRLANAPAPEQMEIPACLKLPRASSAPVTSARQWSG